MLGDVGLNKNDRFRRIDPAGDPVDRHLENVSLNFLALLVLAHERVPVDNPENTIILILELEPIIQRPHQVSQVKLSSRTHCTENYFFHNVWAIDSTS